MMIVSSEFGSIRVGPSLCIYYQLIRRIIGGNISQLKGNSGPKKFEFVFVQGIGGVDYEHFLP
jgi:hypothetical protein